MRNCQRPKLVVRVARGVVECGSELAQALEKRRQRGLGWWLLAASIAVLLLAGCAVGPNYARPTVPYQPGWREGATTTNAAVLPPQWWRMFDDVQLDAFEMQAVQSNQDLQQAVARVKEARALVRVSQADLYPDLTANGSYTRNRLSANSANVPPQKLDFDGYSGSLDMSYELDVWGRVRRTIEAAKADARAVAADLGVVLVTLTADVARDYELIRSLDNEKLVIEATIKVRQDAVQLQETRYRAGLINEMDVTRARTELANAETELQGVLRQRAESAHALAVLCGQPPAGFSVAARATDVKPPVVPAGLPSSLLQRRADIVEAESRLEGASARIGVAKAAFFPTLKLTGAAGMASADLATIVDWPSRFASFGPSISVPVFQGGRNRANLKAAQAQYEESTAGYRGAILNAFREVEDSLSDLSTLASESEAVDRAVISARDTVTLAGERYEKGLTSYLDVVDAQRAELQAERQAAQLRGQRAVSTISLAKALGGGWEEMEVTKLAAAK